MASYIDQHKDAETDVTLLIAAIDFGTTFTGYAFSPVSNKETIHMNKNWGQEFSHTSYKAPTCVLTNPRGEFVSFGYNAEKDYFQLSAEERTGQDGRMNSSYVGMTLFKQLRVKFSLN